MKVDLHPDPQKPGFVQVTPHGSIDSDSHDEFRTKALAAFKPGTIGILVDLTHVDYISSAGLGVFFTLKKRLTEAGGELLFCHLQPQIKRLFEIVKALPKETLFESVEEADRYFYKIMNDEIEKRKGKP